MAEKPHDVIVKFDAYQNSQQHRAVLPAIARLLFIVEIDGNLMETCSVCGSCVVADMEHIWLHV